MKKILLSMALVFAATSAQADIISGGLTLTGNANAPMTFSDGGWGPVSGLPEQAYLDGTASSGTLVANRSGTFVATYLGQIASFSNMQLSGTNLNPGVNNAPIRATASVDVTANQVVNFSFIDGGNGSIFANGMTNTAIQGIAFFANTYGLVDNNGDLFDFLIGYNDSADINADYDDYVVGVNNVPVPAALPLMASALGMFGVARRRNKKA